MIQVLAFLLQINKFKVNRMITTGQKQVDKLSGRFKPRTSFSEIGMGYIGKNID